MYRNEIEKTQLQRTKKCNLTHLFTKQTKKK